LFFLSNREKSPTPEETHVPTLSDFTATTITGEEQTLDAYAGKVALVVNTASKCGFTPQFEGLEKLYGNLREQGLVVLGFPCDQFANQEFDNDAETADFCQMNYGVTFPMFAKVDVNGSKAHPLFGWLRDEQGGVLGDAIKWNFTKFLINRDGRAVARYAPTVAPEDIEADIRALL
jgi:glutathione peroxidase